MDEIENTEIDFDTEETEDMESGAYLATAVVFGAGTLLGVVAGRNWGKAKDAIETRVTARREKKIEKLREKTIEATATEK